MFACKSLLFLLHNSCMRATILLFPKNTFCGTCHVSTSTIPYMLSKSWYLVEKEREGKTKLKKERERVQEGCSVLLQEKVL